MFLPMLKGGKGGDSFNVCNSNSYIVTLHWQCLLTIKIMTIRKGVYGIPDQNGALVKDY